MAETRDDTLRALIRLIPPVRALKDDLDESLHLETYAGTGDLAVKSFQGLQASAARLTDDPYLSALALTAPDDAGDKEKVSLVRLAAGQLAAYLEGQTGVASLGAGEGGNRHYQTAPEVNIQNINGLPAETVQKMLNIGEKAMEGKDAEPA